MKAKFWTSEKILSASALLVSISTFIVFVYQTNLIRKQQFMSVYPHLQLSNYGSGSLEYKYVLINKGVGPALVKSVKIISPSGKTYEDFIDYVANQINEKDSIWFSHSNIYQGRLIAVDEEIFLIQMTDNKYVKEYDLPINTLEKADRMRGILNHDSLKVEIQYESIYGERWTITNESAIPIKH